jgi:hypothetical protein
MSIKKTIKTNKQRIEKRIARHTVFLAYTELSDEIKFLE